MTDEQIQSYFKDVIQKLWPKWPVNEMQFKAWTKVLRPFDNNAVRRATEEHFVSKEGSYGRPKLHEIVELAKKYQPRKTTAEDEPHGHILGFWVECVKHDEKPHYVHVFKKPFYIDAKHRNNYDGVMRAAERVRKQAEELYGGEWLIIQAGEGSVMGEALACVT